MIGNGYISRRNLLRSASLATLGLVMPKTALAQQITPAADTKLKFGIGKGPKAGEPYKLAGNRMVFTNWYYVRFGSFGYYDAKGEMISLGGYSGIFEAQMRQTDAPSGIHIKSYRPETGRAPIEIGTLIRDANVYRAWGDAYHESTDFVNWKKQPFQGNPVGNVFIDPSAPPSERYKSVGFADVPQEQFQAYLEKRPDDYHHLSIDSHPGIVHAVIGSVSPDGINWKQLDIPICVECSDTFITAYYDQRLKKYVMYTRAYPIGPRAEETPYDGFRDQWSIVPRSIGRTESEDFRNFPISKVILEPTPDMSPSDMLYTNGKTTVPGAPDHHLMFPAIWHRDTDTTSVAFLSSHDGELWNYVPGSPLFDTPDFEQWDGGCVFPTVNLVELPDGSFALPYTGYNIPHKYPRKLRTSGTGLLLWPKGRLVALEAPDNGAFTTVAIIPPGRKLKLNALTHRVGKILIEVVAYHDGKAITGHSFADCDPIIGDYHWKTVTWKGADDLGFKDGTAIMLRFKMEKAKIFGLEFA